MRCGFSNKKLVITFSFITSGYILLKQYEDKNNVYVRFLRTFYIGIYNSLDYKWNLLGYDEDSEKYKKTIFECHQRCADRILNGCLKNGGLYIKLGQGLVALNHILPQQYISTLETLHDKAIPQSFDRVRKVFLEDLGKEPKDLFVEFNETPFAAASLAQVHEAVSTSNERLAIKVQYYDLRSRFNADIKTIETLLSIVETIHPTFGFSWVLKDMKATLAQELDFEIEAENSRRCAKDLVEFSDVHVPKVYENLSSKRILTTEFIDGVKVNDINSLKQHKIDLKWLDELMVKVFSHQLFHTGFVHADPHPGNLLVRKRNQKFPELIILDHGLYETMLDKSRQNLAYLIKSLIGFNFKDSEYYSKQLGVNDWETFGEIILQRPLKYENIGKNIKIFQSKLTDEDIEYMKRKSSEHFDKIMDVLKNMPKPMLLFIRNLNTVRSICRLHGDPINRYVYMSDSAIRSTYVVDRNIHYLISTIKLYFELQIFKWKIRNLQEFVKQYLLRYTFYDRKKCSFCAISFIPIINPKYFCFVCRTFICNICLFSIAFENDFKRDVCVKCCVKIVCSNRIGEWFEEITVYYNRKRDTASDYVSKHLKEKPIPSILDENIKWRTIDDTLCKLKYDVEKEETEKRLEEIKSNRTGEEDNKIIRQNSVSSSMCDTTDCVIIHSPTIKLRIHYNKKTFAFEVDIKCCSHLPNIDNKPPNAFIKLQIEPFCVNFNQKSKSKVICSNSNPVFDGHFKTKLSEKKAKSGNLILTVWSKRKILKRKYIGEVVIPIITTVNSSNGEYLNYKIRTEPELSLSRMSSTSDIFGMKTLFSSFKKTVQKVSDSVQDDVPDGPISNENLFSYESYMFFTIKFMKSTMKSNYDIEIVIISLDYFNRILSESQKIKFVMNLCHSQDNEIINSQSVAIDFDKFEERQNLNEKLIFSNIDHNLDFESLIIKLEVFSESDELKADSIFDHNYLFKSIKENIGSVTHASMKIKKPSATNIPDQ